MPRGALGLFGGDEVGRPRLDAGGPEAIGEILEQPVIAGNRAGIEQRGEDGRVAVRLGQAVRHRAGGVADLQAKVPEKIQHEFDDPQHRRAGLVGGQEQQVDVAERRQHAAAVAAGGRHAEPFRAGAVGLAGRCGRRGVQRQREAVQRDDQPVGRARQSPRRHHAGDVATLEALAQQDLDAPELAAEDGQGGVAGDRPAALGGKRAQRLLQGRGDGGRVGRKGCGLRHRRHVTESAGGVTGRDADGSIVRNR